MRSLTVEGKTYAIDTAALRRAVAEARERKALKPVTAGEVDAVQFTVVNSLFGRPGYLEGEVDDFLDRVAATIADQAREIDRLGVLLAREQVSP